MNRVFIWDWKEQPDMDEIFEAIEEFLDEKIRPYFYIVDTGGDDYGVLISDIKELNKKQSCKLWNKLIEGE